MPRTAAFTPALLTPLLLVSSAMAAPQHGFTRLSNDRASIIVNCHTSDVLADSGAAEFTLDMADALTDAELAEMAI